MKPLVIFALAALAVSPAASAGTVTTQGPSTEDKALIATAQSSNPKPNAKTGAAQPGKKALKKAKVTPPPPMHDPN